MIAFLSGCLREILVKSVILDCNGVGYEVFVSTGFLCELTKDEAVSVYVHTHVREDQLVLYGFSTFAERSFFQQLIGISGIGPKTGLEMLNQPIDQLKSAIVNEDADYVARTPGIGKKTANRLIMELKGKIDAISISPVSARRLEMTVRDEVLVALEGLGYRQQQVLRVLDKLPEELKTSEEIVTYFLKNA